MQLSNRNMVYDAVYTTLVINLINNKLLHYTKESGDLYVRLYMHRFFSRWARASGLLFRNPFACLKAKLYC